MNDIASLRTVFFGTPEFASHTLRHLVQNGVNVVAVVTTPDKHQGRGQKVRSSAVATLARLLGIPILAPDSMKDPEFREALAVLSPDIFLVVAFKILPRSIYSLPRLGSFNIHASLLPKYRGAAPINWAIIRGEKETGITTFLLADKVDTGSMLLREAIPIGSEETAGELHDRLMELGARLGFETLRGLAAGSIRPQPQPEGEVTTAPKIFPHDCIINFDQPAEQVHDFIRGMSPHPGAVMTWPDGSKVKVLRVGIAGEEAHLDPGKVLVSQDRRHLYVGTASAPIEALELQKEGRKVLHAEEFLRGDRTV